jgi:hypothetical protein
MPNDKKSKTQQRLTSVDFNALAEKAEDEDYNRESYDNRLTSKDLNDYNSSLVQGVERQSKNPEADGPKNGEEGKLNHKYMTVGMMNSIIVSD